MSKPPAFASNHGGFYSAPRSVRRLVNRAAGTTRRARKARAKVARFWVRYTGKAR